MNEIDLSTQGVILRMNRLGEESVVSEVIVTNGAHSSLLSFILYFVEIIRLKGFDERDIDCYIDISSC